MMKTLRHYHRASLKSPSPIGRLGAHLFFLAATVSHQAFSYGHTSPCFVQVSQCIMSATTRSLRLCTCPPPFPFLRTDPDRLAFSSPYLHTRTRFLNGDSNARVRGGGDLLARRKQEDAVVDIEDIAAPLEAFESAQVGFNAILPCMDAVCARHIQQKMGVWRRCIAVIFLRCSRRSFRGDDEIV